MSELARHLIGEADDMLQNVAAYGLQSGVEKSMRARALDILAHALEINTLDEVGGIGIEAFKEGDNGVYTCAPDEPGIVGWSVYGYPIDGHPMLIMDFLSKEKAYEFVLWLRKAIGEPWVQIFSLDTTLAKAAGEA